MLRLTFILLLGALVAFPANAGLGKHRGGGGVPLPPPSTDEEFVGPFPSWMCARTAASGTCGTAAASFCNAAGNGIADDTTAIQNCITSLSSSKPIIYFPCGTYNISTTLTLTGPLFNELLGQDNSTAAGRCTTTIKWIGASGGKMVYLNGMNYSQLSRLTFDGNSLANILVDQSSSGASDSGDQYIDDVFKNGNDNNTSYGFRCGGLAIQCSEINVLRDTFSNVGFGVATCNANALDVGIWYSSFSNTRLAASNGTFDIPSPPSPSCGGGEFHVIGSVFSGSSLYDLHITGAGDISNYIDNYSSGSQQFFSGFGFPMFLRNTIINTALDGTATGGSISYNGRPTLLDNDIQNTNSTSSYLGGFGRVISMNNAFTNAAPFNSQFGVIKYEFNDQTIVYAPPLPPVLPGTPPNNGRTIYEAASLGLQTAICKASNGPGSTFVSGACTGSPDGLRNVAHLAATGTYTPSATVVVPANSNAQLIGDNWNSTVQSTTANPVIHVIGPSQVTLRDFHVFGGNGSTANDGIHIDGVDQVGAYVYSQAGRYSGSTTGLVLNGLVNAFVEAHDPQMPFNTGLYALIHTGSNHFDRYLGTGAVMSLSGAASEQEVGGWNEASSFLPQDLISGSGSYSHIGAFLGFPGDATFTGSISGTTLTAGAPSPGGSFIFPGARITGTGVSANTVVVAQLTGSPGLAGTYTVSPSQTAGSTSMIAAMSSFNLRNFTGNFTLLNSVTSPNTCPSGFVVNATGTPGSMIVAQNNFTNTTPISNTPGDALQFLSNASANCNTAVLTDSPPPPVLSTVSSALGYLRTTKPLLPNGNPSGTSAVEIYDMFVEGFATSIQISP